MRNYFFVVLVALATLPFVFIGCDDKGQTDPVAVTGVRLNEPTLELVEGAQFRLIATIEPEDAANREMTWKSDSEGVATVVDGVVTAIAEGQAVITVTTTEGGFTAECNVNVLAERTPVEVVILSEELLELVVDDAPVRLEYELRPRGAEAVNVQWSSGDNAIATVVDGLVTPVGAGTTTITLNVDGITDDCEVVVADKTIAVERVELSSETLELAVGDEPATLTYTLFPEGAAGVNIQWSSEDDNIATVDDGVVTAVGRGTVDITINVDGKTDVCVVAVTAEHPTFGFITFKTSTVWEIKNAGGEVIQTWSDAVMGTRCKKDEFNGGTAGGPYIADCRQNTGYGDLFSWEAVNQYKADLCPDGWAVPTSQDFLDLDAVLRPMATEETTIGTVYLESWGGSLGGYFQNKMIEQEKSGRYWSQTESPTNAMFGCGMLIYIPAYLGVTANYQSYNRVIGLQVRCVKK